MRITRATGLREIALLVCTELDRAGVRAILTGGSAATVYAAGDYLSRDLDFIIQRRSDKSNPGEVLSRLGYALTGGIYKHRDNPFTLEFPAGPLSVGRALVDKWETIREGQKVLYILTPTDCCRDRLAGFLFWNDRGSLEQAVAVARRQAGKVDLSAIETWCETEGLPDKYQEFRRALDLASD